MINLDIEKLYFFLDKRTSKNNKDYYALYCEYNDHEELVCFVSKNFYEACKK